MSIFRKRILDAKTDESMTAKEFERNLSLVKLRQITKTFPNVVANDHIDFEVNPGEVHGLLGENGAGKTTLMNILFGLYKPTEGEIYFRGKRVTIGSPREAIKLGISMVHQNFMLFSPLTVMENIVLPAASYKSPTVIQKEVLEMSEKYGLKIDLQAKVWQLSVGEQQRVEIIKALALGGNLLILDEPTSVLAPQEIRDFFAFLSSLASEGRAVIFITHKLMEALSICDRITVLRRGRNVATVEARATNEKELASMMIGRDINLDMEKASLGEKEVLLDVRDLWALNDRGYPSLRGVSFGLRRGEIFGIAGVSGNGQKELAEVLYGLRKAIRGQVWFNGREITNSPTHELIKKEISYIPEDRLKRAAIGDFTIAENMVLDTFKQPRFSKRFFIDYSEMRNYSKRLIPEYDIRAASVDTLTKHLSGGNIQRVIVARELSRRPQLIIASQPTAGLDVGATEYIRTKLLEQKGKASIILISEDLDEIMSMSDRIGVIFKGNMSIVDANQADTQRIGLMMTGVLDA